MTFTQKVYREWSRQWKKGPEGAPSSLFIGVSGGPDSMALLETARHFHPDLTVLHLNHMLRGKEADGDRDFVEDWCQKHNISCYSTAVDVKNLAQEEGISLELAGRQARYQFFEEYMVKADHPPLLLTAHHQDDQAETVLLHLLRGSGIHGAGGIRPLSTHKFSQEGMWKTYAIFRPFLGLPKEALYGFLKEQGIPYREDNSNDNDVFLRNRIRLHLLPDIQSTVNPRAVEALSRFARILQLEDDFLDRMSEKALEGMVYPPARENLNDLDRLLIHGQRDEWIFQRNALLLGGISLRKKDLLALEPALAYRVIRKALQVRHNSGDRSFEITFKDVEEIYGLAGGSVSTWSRLCGMIILCDFQGLSFLSEADFDGKSSGRIEVGGVGERRDTWKNQIPIFFEKSKEFSQEWTRPAGYLLARICRGPVDKTRLHNPRFAYFPAQALTRLSVGPGRPGEIFEKFGGRKKTLRKVFNEWKIPSSLRENYPLVWEGEKIIWIPWAGRSGYGPLRGEAPVVEMEWRPKWTKI